MNLRVAALLLGLPLLGNAAPMLPPVTCDGAGPCREAGTNLPLLVLPRSFSHLYRDADFQQVLVENLEPFKPLYVFAREVWGGDDEDGNPRGRYQVGYKDRAPAAGWMRAADALEWRQALTAAFTHPGSGEEARQRVLMFRRVEDLDAMLASEQVESRALDLYRRIEGNDIPPEVLSKEPEAFVDIAHTFYLLPIVEAQLRDLYGDELRLVRLASALPGERVDPTTPDVLASKVYREQSAKSAPAPEQVRNLGVDLVFVMDMTLSMQSYIDRTRDAVKAIVQSLSAPALAERFRFGLVGFRDDVRKVPALEFVSRNFTPRLVDAAAFASLLETQAQAAQVSSPGYSEDVFAGVEAGLDSAWRDNSVRFLVLVGDASGHPPGHDQSSTKKDAQVLRLAAENRQVHLLAMQLLNPGHPEDQPVAEAQFSQLARVRGAAGSALVQVRTDQEEDFQRGVDTINDSVTRLLREVDAKGSEVLDALAAPPADDSVAGQTGRAMDMIIRSAMVEYLGQDAKPPRDLLVWAADRDLTNPSVSSLEIRMLLTREQLSDLILGLDRVLTAMLEAKSSNIDFFDSLQGLAVQTMKNPEAIARVDSLRESGLVPAFIDSLPYRSEVLSLDRERYASLTAEQRARLLERLTAKLNQYRKINESVDGWAALNPGAGDTRRVYPLQLDFLP